MGIDRKRLERSIDDLGRIGETPRGGLTRLALTDEDKRGRDWIVARMREAGLRVTVDQMGNIFGERPGAEPLPPVLMGSHVDSVPTGGKYDGQLGVLCGLETIRTLNDQRSEEHTSELQSRLHLVCRLLLEKKKEYTSHNAERL